MVTGKPAGYAAGLKGYVEEMKEERHRQERTRMKEQLRQDKIPQPGGDEGEDGRRPVVSGSCLLSLRFVT